MTPDMQLEVARTRGEVYAALDRAWHVEVLGIEPDKPGALIPESIDGWPSACKRSTDHESPLSSTVPLYTVQSSAVVWR